MKPLAAIVLTLVLGCSAPPGAVQPRADGPPARIDLARIVAGHPLAPVLAQYGADIATLRRAGTSAGIEAGTTMESGALDVERRTRAASQRLAGLRAQPVAPIASDPVRRDLDGGVVGAFAQAAQSRVLRAVNLRAAQLHEHEATVAYDFERAHAGRRLVLELKLRNLHLDGPSRRRYRAQLDELDKLELHAVDAARAADNAVLVRYGAKLKAQAGENAASMAGDFANHARAMRTLPQPQMGLLAGPLLHLPDTRASAAAAFNDVRRDVTSRILDLRAQDRAANADLAQEIANLERERDALRAQIVASIETRAQRIAAAQHLGRVYASGAPAAARDITGDVARSFSSEAALR